MCSHAVNVALNLGYIGTRQFGSLTQRITNNDDRAGYTGGEVLTIRMFRPGFCKSLVGAVSDEVYPLVDPARQFQAVLAFNSARMG
jgi:hypothetical protein